MTINAAPLVAGTTFARSIQIVMTGYGATLPGAWFLQFVPSSGVGPALSFSSADGNIQLVTYAGGVATLALLASAQSTSRIPVGSYIGNVLYQDAAGIEQVGDIISLAVSAAITQAHLLPPPPFSPLSGWGPLIDITGTASSIASDGGS